MRRLRRTQELTGSPTPSASLVLTALHMQLTRTYRQPHRASPNRRTSTGDWLKAGWRGPQRGRAGGRGGEERPRWAGRRRP